jgi:hypothetical protein
MVLSICGLLLRAEKLVEGEAERCGMCLRMVPEERREEISI